MIYPYLENKEFLKRLDVEERKVQYVRITALDFKTEAAIAHLEGIATGGSVNLNGSSNVRRTMSCSLLVKPEGLEKQGSFEKILYSNITEIQNLISLNKKISAEIGFENTLTWDDSCYPEYDIIWIPLGTYIIKSASVARSNSGVNISLTLNDKTALLNGDVGGIIPAGTVLSEVEEYNADATERVVKKLLFKDIIKYLVVDLGGEDPGNVIIEDIPDTIRKVMKWTGDTSLYYDNNKKIFDTIKPSNFNTENGDREFEFGQDCGYVVEPFCYPGVLECNAGDNVAAMLDKVKNTLGNFEWFYDVWGRFHFQEKKNYINTSHATTVQNLTEAGYLATANLSRSVYTFDESNRKLLTNISSAPQYQNVKNDFIVWGSTKTASGATKPIRYHLAFDTKPDIKDEPRLCIVYTDYRGLQQVIILKEDVNYKIGSHPANYTVEDKTFYYLVNDGSKYVVDYWDQENKMFRIFEEWEVCYLKTDDWRTELYFLGLEDSNKTFAKNYYAAELNAEWPKIYDVKSEPVKDEDGNICLGDYGPIYTGAYRNIEPSQYEYFLDFIEGSQGGCFSISLFNVNNIGRRTKVGKDNSANCVFTTTVPNILFINASSATKEDYANSISGYEIVNVSEEIFNELVVGGNSTSAYDKVKELLIQHTHYNEAITLTTIPIYYLEPNNRIHIEDTELGINGDYLMNTISLPLTIGTSSISCTRCIENTI